MTQDEAQAIAAKLREQYRHRQTVFSAVFSQRGWVVSIDDPLICTVVYAIYAREAEFSMACIDLLATMAERE